MNEQIRAWALANDVTVGKRGRLSRETVVAYLSAHPSEARRLAEVAGVPTPKRGRLGTATVAAIAATV